MTYAQQLKDPRWQKRRLDILNRDGFQCRRCRSKEKTLHVHHALYRKGAKPWEYEDELLMTFCEDCHKEVEDEREELLSVAGQEPHNIKPLTLLAEAMGCRAGSLTFIGWAAESIAHMIHLAKEREEGFMSREDFDCSMEDYRWTALKQLVEASDYFQKMSDDLPDCETVEAEE